MVIVVRRNIRAHAFVHFSKTAKHPTLKFRHFLGCKTLFLRHTVQRAEHIAQRVAETTIKIACLLQNIRTEAHILRIIGRQNPQAQNIRAEGPHHLVRVNDVAKRFGLLISLFI